MHRETRENRVIKRCRCDEEGHLRETRYRELRPLKLAQVLVNLRVRIGRLRSMYARRDVDDGEDTSEIVDQGVCTFAPGMKASDQAHVRASASIPVTRCSHGGRCVPGRMRAFVTTAILLGGRRYTTPVCSARRVPPLLAYVRSDSRLLLRGCSVVIICHIEEAQTIAL